MIRLIIIGEGQTEQAFCKDVLQPYFVAKSIYIQNPTIKKSKGGIVAWEELKKEILNHLKSDTTAYVSLLIDYYGIKAKHGFPKWDEAQTIVDKNERMDFLEGAMLSDIKEKYQNRFIPYIQLHEFEGLLFCEQDVFDDNFEDDEFLDHKYLDETINLNPNPEMINEGSTTAPSKRLMKIIEGYQKTVHGPLIAQEIGLRKMRQKCPRFNRWVEKLSELTNQ
jgi:hypothetical protein